MSTNGSGTVPQALIAPQSYEQRAARAASPFPLQTTAQHLGMLYASLAESPTASSMTNGVKT